MNKRELIGKISFGQSIAEQESEKLKDYFLQTEFWKNIRNGTNDIVYGAKGAGKSALYMSLANDINTLFDEGILVSVAENPKGETVFSNLTSDPPTSQSDFVRLWKLYFLVITARILDDYDINDADAKQVKQILIDSNLVPAQNNLKSILTACINWVKLIRKPKEISTTMEFDPLGSYSGQKFSISFDEPSKSDFDKGIIPIEHVYDLLTKSLKSNKISLWIIIDRLDVAFLESEELETNALRALFKTYLDLSLYSEIKIKIFLRDDIWNRITSEGFREASHITKFQSLGWTRESLLNLLIRRILDNSPLITQLNINKDEVLSDIDKQEELFYALFPRQIDIGAKKPQTLEWVLTRTKDGKGVNTPRELIQLFTHAKEIESKRIENGINDLTDNLIISRQALKEAVKEVSKQRMEQTIYAEFPILKEVIEKLRGDKAEHTFSTLSSKWNLSEEETNNTIKKLLQIGFLEQKGDKQNSKYLIPFMYRPYLGIVQGKATIN
jgi:hypothetical protein